MFDVGFWELAIIMIVAMLVIGPERLPRVARTVGLWLGRARSAFNSVKADIDRELRAEELKTMLDKQAEVPELKRFREELSRDVDAPSTEADATPKSPPAKDAQPPSRDDERD
ncbi:MAG: Sec-independent protein translocase protein TatB [Gammaproteobacteria bacterium]|nr:Sec-independent protein translocase protein TatB [Gammaproteobacteria bacterium]